MQRIPENTSEEVNFSFVIGLQLLAVIVEEKLNRRYFSNIFLQFRKAPLFSWCSDINWRRGYYVWSMWKMCHRKASLPNKHLLLKFTNNKTRKSCGICSELTIKTPERRQRHLFDVFIVSFKDILNLFLVFPLLNT